VISFVFTMLVNSIVMDLIKMAKEVAAPKENYAKYQ
jgi:hypothetical protein